MRRGDRSRFGDFCLPKEKAGTRNRAGIKVYERGLGKQHRVLVRWGGLPCVPATWWECGTEEPRSPPCPSFIASHDLACAQLGGGLCHTAHPTSRAPLILFPFIFIFCLCPQLAAPSGGALISAAYVEHCPPAVPTPPELGWGCRHQPPPILVASPYPHGTDGEGAGCASFLQDLSGVLWRGDPESCFGVAAWGKKAGIQSGAHGKALGLGDFVQKHASSQQQLT